MLCLIWGRLWYTSVSRSRCSKGITDSSASCSKRVAFAMPILPVRGPSYETSVAPKLVTDKLALRVRVSSKVHWTVVPGCELSLCWEHTNNHGREAEDSGACGAVDKTSDARAPFASINLNVPKPASENGTTKVNENDASALEELPDQLDFLPDLKEVKAKVQEDKDLGSELNVVAKEDAQNGTDGVNDNVDLEVDDNDNVSSSKIELLMKLEAEAIDRGLQKDEVLEEIQESDSGTCGAVRYGRGSDVATTKIKV
ncbi:hypothetical protein Pfo_000799 [Paulownia fortunei]|nr:hypothetical protein Pfo_000799 [Paulownia fortunei]